MTTENLSHSVLYYSLCGLTTDPQRSAWSVDCLPVHCVSAAGSDEAWLHSVVVVGSIGPPH